MADISSYLAAIMAAVYGEDVRGSIHDAIDIINKVGEVVLNTGTAVTGPTSSSTGFYDGSFYINTNTMELWKCIGTDAWQSQGVLKGADGADGNGIVSIVKTATVGLVDTYTITFDDGSTETYQITNGQNGSKWYKGTAISGTGTSITGFPGTKDDFYLNSVDGYVYVCVKTGGAMVPDAAEWDYVMTLTGGGGGSITVIDNLISTSSTDALSANQGRVLNTSKIDNPSTKSDGQVLTYNAIDDEWEARNATGGGMLPYLYIDSEAGSTVTVNQPDGTTITPTAAGSGHWECELTGGYGTYVIHSVLAGQGDATQSLVVDTVMEYHVTDTHYDHTVSFVAPSGSTVRIEGGTEIYTLTGTGSTQTQVVHTASTSFTVTATMDGNGKPYTFTTPSTSGQTTTIPSGTFDFGTINVTVDPDFVTAGSTITCIKGVTSCTPKTAASSLTFRVPSTGTWTISGEVSGTPYSTTATVTSLSTPVLVDLETMPNGATVLPIDDIKTWLKCAGITDKAYTTLAQVLADTDTLVALCADSNACDYMARSTTWASGVTTDADAMNIVGKYDYCANALLSDATWASAILASSYVDYVVEVKCPTMTSNNTPSGYQVIPESVLGSSYDGFKAFDGNNSTQWVSDSSHSIPVGSTNTGYIIFKFPSPVVITNAAITSNTNSPTQAYTISGSNDNSTYTPITTGGALSQTALVTFANTVAYEYYKIELTQKNADSSAIEVPRLLELQYYGRTEKNYTGTVIHSAVEDVTYYVSGGSNVPFCTIASGDTDTVSSSIISSLKGQTVTIGSSVAKDPANLANDYTKSVRITPNVTEIYLMPDNALYWWGYIDKECEELSTANGWSSSGATFSSPTYSKNNAVLSAGETTYAGIGSKLSNAITSAHSIVESTNLNNNVGLRAAILTSKAIESGTSTDYAHQVTAQTVANTIQKIDVIYSASYCCAVAWQNSRAGKLYALWYE